MMQSVSLSPSNKGKNYAALPGHNSALWALTAEEMAGYPPQPPPLPAPAAHPSAGVVPRDYCRRCQGLVRAEGQPRAATHAGAPHERFTFLCLLKSLGCRRSPEQPLGTGAAGTACTGSTAKGSVLQGAGG